MFSGIVETTGRIFSLKKNQGCLQISVQPEQIFDDVCVGDSVAINGVCLTVTALHENRFDMTIVPETLRITNLNTLIESASVNVARSLKVTDRIGGHCVQGHVDGVGKIIEIKQDGEDAWIVKMSVDKTLSKYMVNKGFITLDGMSITVIAASQNDFTVTLIPYTRQVTIAHQYQVGHIVNIEIDIFAKTIEKLLKGNSDA